MSWLVVRGWGLDIKRLFMPTGSETSLETWLGEETRMKKLIVIPAFLLVGCAGTECQYSDTIAEAVDAYCEAATEQEVDVIGLHCTSVELCALGGGV